jgi:hypothetical protein
MAWNSETVPDIARFNFINRVIHVPPSRWRLTLGRGVTPEMPISKSRAGVLVPLPPPSRGYLFWPSCAADGDDHMTFGFNARHSSIRVGNRSPLLSADR